MELSFVPRLPQTAFTLEAPVSAAYLPFRMRARVTKGAGSGHGPFATTQWSIVLAAGHADTPASRQALERLYAIYWYPLYAFVRRSGFNPTDAEDLTQAFFVRLIDKRDLAAVDRARGRFRSFLLAAMKNFLANEWDRRKTAKRGGGDRNFTSLDARDAESRLALEPADALTPDRLFDRAWALTLLDTTLRRTREAYEADGRGPLFTALQGTLSDGETGTPYAELGPRLGLSEDAVKQAVRRLRHRYRDILRAEIAATLDDPSAVDEELQTLFAALSH